MKIGPKFKIGKRLGPGVFDKCQTQKFMVSQARSERSKRRRPAPKSDYAKQFLEKQKVRFTYGVTEKQFKNYVNETMDAGSSNASEMLFSFLERRLDNVIYRLGITPSRRAARQMVAHGHILVNGRRTSIPSYRVDAGDQITVREGSKKSSLFMNLVERTRDQSTPTWVSFDPEKVEAKVSGLPAYDRGSQHFDLSPVLEFYSR